MKSFSIHDTILSFRQDEEKRNLESCYSHYELYRKVLNYLGSIGFYVSSDKEIDKNYPILSKDHHYGRYAELEFKSERYPAGFKIEFFQNINFENRHGGYYDNDKLKKMPYLVGKQFELTIKKLSRFLIEKGVMDDTKPIYKNAKAKIKYDYATSWHHPQKDMNFFLSELHGTTCESYNNKDRDGYTLYNGDIKYFRDFNGYLYRGRIYHNINNMWWVIVNRNELRNIACFDLFDLSPIDFRGRQKKSTIPDSFKVKRESLTATSSKELIRELKRRGRIKKGRVINA